MKTLSPLRYPGGKACLADYLRRLIELNVVNCTYFELYAGGAGAALDLLFNGPVQRIVLNDADIHLFSFWTSILHETEAFVKKIEEIPINITSWHIQREIYDDDPSKHTLLELGFATFFLNRCNRSGIITKAGPIGGIEQNGNYLIDCRFNKADLISRIKRISNVRDQIEVYQQDTIQFINQNIDRLSDGRSFLYLDPPYYQKGKSLYLNAYEHDDHVALRDLLSNHQDLKWIISYDNVDPITELYAEFKTSRHQLSYSLQNKRKTKEFFVFSNALSTSPELFEADEDKQ